MWDELGISGGTAIIVLIALYFIIKWAVKNGVKEACEDIKLMKTLKEIQDHLGKFSDKERNITASTSGLQDKDKECQGN